MPYGVLQCIRGHKSFVARRVADNRGAQGVSAGAAARKALSFYHVPPDVTGESEFYEFADISQPESTIS